ncbi:MULTISPECIES: RagB/SusD family nutrient uptake outer membrane protein [Sphingobacterium]|uniref:RagB/SusD family nutrient uptake outer membrane protein n=1 Tax=Sphingobacterium TaxID=28453 RepID=UPI00257ADABC|nr:MULTISPECIES: RagB/SusD family nutrient uptake outer membrane protein [Sphingobacterium]
MASCNKFLEDKTNKTSTVPSTLEDLQALLDAGNQLNLGSYPFFLEACTDDFLLTDAGYNNLDVFDKQVYTFQNPDLYSATEKLILWRDAYKAIAIANTVLDGLSDIKILKGLDPNNIKGQALFHRAFMHFILLQIYAAPFDQKGNNNVPGIPIKLSSDINDKTKRSTVGECYRSVIQDLEEAAGLLPNELGIVTRPNKISAHAALSRVYMAMEDYENAKKYAELVLIRYDKLMDLNTMSVDASFPYPAMNAETLFFAYSNGTTMFGGSRGSYMTDDLLSKYDTHDLRFRANYKKGTDGRYTFKGHYVGSGTYLFFVGLTTSEVLLNAAESNTRLGNATLAKQQLNELLQNRIEKQFFVPITESNIEVLLKTVIRERRKELVRRGLRWSDLRRLNKDERFKKEIVRKVTIDGKIQEFSLKPISKDYIFNIPIEVKNITGIE